MVTKPPPADVLLVSLGTTHGLRRSDAALAGMLGDAGLTVRVARARMGRAGAVSRLGPPAYPATDLVQAAAARRAAVAALGDGAPRAVIFSTATAALLAPPLDRPYAVWLDSPTALNRPGRRNAAQHALERRRLAGAAVVLPWSVAAREALPDAAAPSVVLPPPVAAVSSAAGPRERVAIAYATGPRDKGLDLLARAWTEAAVADARLEVHGLDAEAARTFLRRARVAEPPNVEWRGVTPPPVLRAALGRATALVSATRWEDFGLVQLEALSDGALLVCAPAGGAFAALPIARALAPRLVAVDRSPTALANALREAFALPEPAREAYAAAAAEHVAPLRPDAVSATLVRDVLPRLLA
jgi:hypothetical protein